MDFFGLGGANAHIDVQLDPADPKRHKRFVNHAEGKSFSIRPETAEQEYAQQKNHVCEIFTDNEPIKGRVEIHVPARKKLETPGVTIALLGIVELYNDRNQPRKVFHECTQRLSEATTLSGVSHYEFEFEPKERDYESYTGINVRCRYLIEVTVERNYFGNITSEKELIIQKISEDPQDNQPIQMEVGIEECLHIEFEYGKEHYHLDGIITGKVHFRVVRIKVKHMELSIVRRETSLSDGSTYTENDTVCKYEVMDGAPVREEVIPLRLYLGGFDLTPTYDQVHEVYSVKYFLNLVLVDEEDRRYFKQHEVKLWRKNLK